MDLGRDASRWREGLLCPFVGDELELHWRQFKLSNESIFVLEYAYRPKEAPASDVADMWVAVEVLVQKLAQVLPIFADIFHQVLVLHDTLNLQRGGTAYRMPLVGVSVREGTGQVRL